MIYKFSDYLELNYHLLEKFINNKEVLTKNELLQKCIGDIDYDLLQSLKEMEFSRIGKTEKGEIYLV